MINTGVIVGCKMSLFTFATFTFGTSPLDTDANLQNFKSERPALAMVDPGLRLRAIRQHIQRIRFPNREQANRLQTARVFG